MARKFVIALLLSFSLAFPSALYTDAEKNVEPIKSEESPTTLLQVFKTTHTLFCAAFAVTETHPDTSEWLSASSQFKIEITLCITGR